MSDSVAGDVVVIELAGKIMGDMETAFSGKMQEYIGQNKRNFVIDLHKVEWANSRGIGMLVGARNTAEKNKGRLVLTNIENIESLLITTRLVTLFQIFDDRQSAINSFTG